MILDQEHKTNNTTGVDTWSVHDHLFAPEKMIDGFDRHLPPWMYGDSGKSSSADQSAWSGSGQGPYHGVRVKNTVKELIMKKRLSVDIQSCPRQQTENDCPVLTSILQVRKRPASDTLAPVQPKRPSTNHNNVLSGPQADNMGSSMCSSLPEHIINLLQYPPPHTDVGMDQNGWSPLTPSLPDEEAFFASSNSFLFAPSSQAQTAEGPPSCPFQYKLSPSQMPLQESSPQLSFFHWQIQQEEGKLAGLTPDQLTTQDEDGDTFLHIAVAQGRRALAYVLAKKMADAGALDMKEHNKQSALQLSVAANQHLITQDLLSLGAQLNTTDLWGRSPLHVCAEKGYAHTLKAIQKSIQSSGQKFNAEVMNYDGLTPLHSAVLAHNAVVQDMEREGDLMSLQTLSLVQNRKMLKECIQTLLALGASIQTQELKSGRTALHMASEEANMELLTLFLEQPQALTTIKLKAYNGNTALHITSSLQGRIAQVNAVRLLMRKGADPGAKNLENETPAQLVPEGERGDQVRSILKGRGIQVRTTLP